MLGTRPRIAFLSMGDLSEFTCDDDLAVEPLAELGWQVDRVPWRSVIDWSVFQAVLIRSTWDYQRDLPGYLAALERISTSTRLWNPLEVVRWNADKRYLRELERQGTRIVPTFWGDALRSAEDLHPVLGQFDAPECVIKPTVSANADFTFRLPSDGPIPAEVADVFRRRSFMVQPFMSRILEEGEFSVFVFGGELSHAIQKVPRATDYRVQEEHGGDIRSYPLTSELGEVSLAVLSRMNQPLLYARVDWVRDADGQLCLMELELIEPALYLRTDPESPRRFAQAIGRVLVSA